MPRYIKEIEDVQEPFCGRRRPGTRSLAEAYPEIAFEWCYLKNAGWGPDDFSHAQGVRAWWVCSICDREYKTVISYRTSKGSGCHYCASKRVCKDNALSKLYPDIAKSWHPTKNKNLKVSEVTFASMRSVWWLCPICQHDWKTRIQNRTHYGHSCPKCYQDQLKLNRNKRKPKKTIKAFENDVALIYEQANRLGCTASEVLHAMCKEMSNQIHSQYE